IFSEFSHANDCLAAGYGCVPADVCPEEHRKPESGCSTVCCDLNNVRTCAARGGECNPLQTECKEDVELTPTCGSERKCCIYL
ncbi:unnamed protein product, partial [Ixodes hexagonus]